MYSEIKEQFREVIAYSQGIPDPQVNSLFERWEKAKTKFIKRFGGLIYEWPEVIEFTLDSKERQQKAMEFANCVYDSFHNSELASFLDSNLETFFENKVSNTDNGRVPEGMKLIKAFKFYEKDKKTLRAMQDMASQIIQENKISGKLCFSVHPLDFLSSSENTYNWRSCHALDGEYRAGNLSYMVDECTFMVYLKGADDVRIPLFNDVKWNSKKWRMLLHTSTDDGIMFAGRQYPFSSKSGIDIVLNIYNNLLEGEGRDPWNWYNKYSEWHNEYIDTYISPDQTTIIDLDSRYMVYCGQLVDIHQVVKSGRGALNYNDILQSTCYLHPYYAILNPYRRHSVSYLTERPLIIGGEIICLHCGGETVDNAETMRCDDCEINYGYEENDNYTSCSCCGSRIYIDDAYPIGAYGDDLVCSSCYDSECFICDYCDETHYKSDRVFMPFGFEGIENAWYCQRCYRDYQSRNED